MSSTKVIVGREEEQASLAQFFNSPRAEFLAVYGRHRVGKTYLIREYFHKKKSCTLFYVTGIFRAPMKRQLKEFTKEIGHVFFHGMELKEKTNWFDTFELLSEAINKQIAKNQKIVLFFDEFPWMATPRSKLLEALEYYWNRYWSLDKRIKLIICGSAASWIIKNIINNKGGLHNRLTHTINLRPLTLCETKEYLKHINFKLNERHVTQIYMTTGGIPYYLSQIHSGNSATQIIEGLGFSKNNFLLREFDNLYASLFTEAESYIELVRTIARKKYGIGQDELIQLIPGASKGGTLVDRLRDLESAGFIMSFKPFHHQKKGIRYRVIDEYSLFYFDWIEPIKEALLAGSLQKGYWENIHKTPTWHNWAGYAFEAICFKHLPQIAKALSLPASAIPFTWHYKPSKTSKEDGAQIDLLFDRNDDAITLCEIKYTELPFVIDKNYAAQLKRKIDVFQKITRTHKQLILVMICANGLKPSMYSEEIVQQVVTLEDLFQ